jgi:hypothetical protein
MPNEFTCNLGAYRAQTLYLSTLDQPHRSFRLKIPELGEVTGIRGPNEHKLEYDKGMRPVTLEPRGLRTLLVHPIMIPAC